MTEETTSNGETIGPGGDGVGGQPRTSLDDLIDQVRQLTARVDDLEKDVAVQGRVARDVADLADIVQELLMPDGSSQESPERMSKRLRRYLKRT